MYVRKILKKKMSKKKLATKIFGLVASWLLNKKKLILSLASAVFRCFVFCT